MSDEQDWFYVVKLKHWAEVHGEEEYVEYTYRVARSPHELPDPDDDLGFLGFRGDYSGSGVCRSKVCTNINVVDEGSRTHRKLKDRLAKKAWGRQGGGI